MARLGILGLWLLLEGCSNLIIHDDDSVVLVVGKVVARSLVAIPTLGISETTLVDLKDEERNRAWRKQLLPQNEQACVREWRDYLTDRYHKILFEGLPQLMASIVAQDHISDFVSILGVPDLLSWQDPMKREWEHTLAREPQAALLSECALRFNLQRFFPRP